MDIHLAKYRILCIDNDEKERDNLCERLIFNGYFVEKTSISDFLKKNIIPNRTNLILLGVQTFDDADLLKKLKDNSSTADIPVFVYSSIIDEFFEVTVFRNGAEDFIPKPVRIAAFIARIETFFSKNKGKSNQNIILVAGLEINPNNLSVKFPTGKHIYLPKKEYYLLSFLAINAGQIFNRNQLLNKIWGEDIIIGERTVDVHIRRLRKKIGSNYIKTLKGVGYTFEK